MCMPEQGFYRSTIPPEGAQYFNESSRNYYKIVGEKVQLYLWDQHIWIDAGWPATSVLLHHFIKLEN